MSRLFLIALAPLALASPALAQHDHHAPPQPVDPHAGHQMPAPAPDPHTGHAAPKAAGPHAGHAMPPPDPRAGHATPKAADPHAGHQMPAPPKGDPPPIPTDHAAERFHDPAAMAAARAQLRKEHGDVRYSKVMLETAEWRDDDGYAWEGQASFGGDIHRIVLTIEGEGEGGHLEAAEAQALYSRAVGPFFNLQAGLRHDFRPRPDRTYATVGLAGLAPYWFEVGAAGFLSNTGDLSARFEASYDLRLTQSLILEPRAELELAAQDTPELGIGAGLTDVELGLRLRYAIRQEFAPYVGVFHERKFGETANLARAAGETARDTRFVVGLRAWF